MAASKKQTKSPSDEQQGKGKAPLEKEGASVAPPPTEKVRQDKVLWLSVALYLGLIGLLWGLKAWGTPAAAVGDERLKVTVFDAIATPGSAVTLGAKYEKNLPGPMNPDKKGLSVVIAATTSAEQTKKLATTNNDGIATTPIIAPKDAGNYLLFSHATDPNTKYVERHQRSEPALLFVIPADAPVLICDIDGTITKGETLSPPMAGAAEVVTELAKKYSIIYVTARDDALLNLTRNWLEQHRFPRAPVVCRDWTVTNLSKTGEYKNAAIQVLQQSFKNIRWAIGNSDGDKEAYAQRKIEHVIINGDMNEVVNGVRRHGVKEWQKVREIILGSE